MVPFERVSSERLFDGFMVNVDRLHFAASDGTEFDREIVRHPGAVAVVPIDEDGHVILIRQFRAAVGGRILEVTAGTCDVSGEGLEATAHRELLEEVGLVAEHLEPLGVFVNSPGYCDQRTVVFLATGLTEVLRAPEGPEELDSSVERYELSAAVEMVEQGIITDGTTAYGLLRAARRRGC